MTWEILMAEDNHLMDARTDEHKIKRFRFNSLGALPCPTKLLLFYESNVKSFKIGSNTFKSDASANSTLPLPLTSVSF